MTRVQFLWIIVIVTLILLTNIITVAQYARANRPEAAIDPIDILIQDMRESNDVLRARIAIMDEELGRQK